MGRMPMASVQGWRGKALVGLLALLCLLPLLAAAQDKPLSAFYRETWTTRQGLPHNQVNAIAQSPDGYLWLGTWEGWSATTALNSMSSTEPTPPS
jgi:ligand-binding sensor domain-containing protein